ncbi:MULTISPECIES: hypothetical protein [Kitasatospora]|nr:MULTISPECIES: hypothetical protein [Kitasatospora]
MNRRTVRALALAAATVLAALTLAGCGADRFGTAAGTVGTAAR